MRDTTGLLLAPIGHLGQRHASFELRNGALLVTPSRGPLRRAGLALYNPQRVTGSAAKALMRCGIWPSTAVDVRAASLEELRKLLADIIGECPVECAFQFGSTGTYSKVVILVMDRAGRPLAYAKLATLPKAREALGHEAKILERLSSARSLDARIPRVLGRAEWRGFPLLVISAGPSRRAAKLFGSIHRDFLERLAEATRTRVAFPSSRPWAIMTRTFAECSSALSSQWRARFEQAIFTLERRFGTAQLDFALAHCDFVGSNMRLNKNGDLFVFDWELSRADSTIGWDFFHFHTAWAHKINRRDVAKLTASARREKIEPADDLLLAYLVDVALFYLDLLLKTGMKSHPLLAVSASGIDLLIG